MIPRLEPNRRSNPVYLRSHKRCVSCCRRSELLSLFRRIVEVTHDERLLDQRFDTAKAWPNRGIWQASMILAVSRANPPLSLQRSPTTEAAHHPLGDRVCRMGMQPGIVNLRDPRVLGAKNSATACPLVLCRSIRRANVWLDRVRASRGYGPN